MKEKKSVLFICQAALIAALYVVLCLVFKPFSFGAIQCRIAEALTILPVFTPAAIPGVAIGCLLSNILGAHILDIVFGSLATLIGAVGTYSLRKRFYLAPIPPILTNTIIIPYVLRFAHAESAPIYLLGATIFAGEIISCGVLGLLLYFALRKYKRNLFKL